MAHNINHVQYVYMQNPGMQQAPAGQTYQLPPNSLAGVISAARPNTGGFSITHFKRSVGHSLVNAAPQYTAWRNLVKDQLLARNFTPLANFPIADFQEIVAGMRRLLPACDRLATASAANNVHNMQQADEGIVQLVKDCIDKLITTMNRRAQKVANGQAVPPIGQPGVPPAQLNVSALLLPPGGPAQWGPAMADPNPAPFPQNALPPINQPQAQGQVVPGVVPAQAQPPINQPQAQPQAQPLVDPGAVPAQAQPLINHL